MVVKDKKIQEMSKHYYICCAKYDIITYLAAGMEIYDLLWVEQKKN